MDRRYRLNLLTDFYGALLGGHALEFMRLRYEEDMSLQEIAESFGVSRQAVHDSISKSEKLLDEYEEKLGLIRRFDEMRKKLAECQARLDLSRQALDEAQKLLEELKND